MVFKLNPGHNNNTIDSIVTTHRKLQKMMSTSTRNTTNLVNICCEPYIRNAIHPLSLCMMNTQSIRNKTADFVDYVCENEFDLVAVTETWLKAIDDSVRAQLCPTGYKFLDKSREGRRGGGTALLYRDSLRVTMANSGQLESFEYSEWIVTPSASNNLRIFIFYRPPYSEDHRVPMSVFFDEFSNHIESVILSKEQLLIIGDFNIHVDVSSDPDTMTF